MREAERRAVAAESVEDARIEDLQPAAAAVLEGVRAFTIKARGQLVVDGRTATALNGEPMLHTIDAAMASYVERAPRRSPTT